MNRITELREQIDACRPGSDDLALPGLADLALAVGGDRAAASDRAVAEELDRSQQFDRAVISALHDVPVPGDLLERLLAQAERNKALVASEVATEANAPSPAASSTPAKRGFRRWILAGVGLAALAASLLALGLFLPEPARDVSQSELAEAAADWFSEAADPASTWTAYTTKRAPHNALRELPKRSRQMQTAFGPATVYDLSSSRGGAFLVVLSTRDRFDVDPLPFADVRGASRGFSIGAWQSGGQLFVLVSKNGVRLDELLRRPPAA
jgi:hypothetical protein